MGGKSCWEVWVYIGAVSGAGGMGLFGMVFVDEGEGDTTGPPGCLQRAQIAAESPDLNRPPASTPEHFAAFAPTLWPEPALRPQLPLGHILTGSDVATRIRPLG